MSRHKAYSLSPRDCLKTTLFQKWQRMVAPPGKRGTFLLHKTNGDFSLNLILSPSINPALNKQWILADLVLCFFTFQIFPSPKMKIFPLLILIYTNFLPFFDFIFFLFFCSSSSTPPKTQTKINYQYHALHHAVCCVLTVLNFNVFNPSTLKIIKLRQFY